MKPNRPSQNTRTTARQFVDRIASKGATDELLDAITADLHASAERAATEAHDAEAAELRLENIERRINALAEAVLALARADEPLPAAVETVKRMTRNRHPFSWGR